MSKRTKLNRFKNSKQVIRLGSIFPLVFIYPLYESIGHIGIGALFLLAFPVCVYLWFIIFELFTFSNKSLPIIIFPRVIKEVKSKHGYFILVGRKAFRDNHYVFYVYQNKYWFFLSRISTDKVFTPQNGNIIQFNGEVRRIIKEYIQSKRSIRDKNFIKKWDGIVDENIRREETINDLID